MRNSKVMMIMGLLVGILCLGFALSGEAKAATLDWDRNSETNMKDYNVYVCVVKGCIVQATAAQLKQNVLQTPVGTRPTIANMDLANIEGAAAVTARDLSGQESALSVQVPFNFKIPAAPTNLHIN